MAGFGYDNPGKYEDSGGGGGLVPSGWAPMKLIKVEEKSNDSGWRGLSMEFEIVGGPHKGRRVWPLYTTHHRTSEKAVEIGRGKIGHLVKAAGRPDAMDTDEVIGVVIDGKIGIKKGSAGYDDKNDVLDFRPFEPGATGDLAAAERAFADDDDLPF
jgi:hypothetical protein